MKNDSLQESNESKIQVKCPKNNEATTVCFSHSCQAKAFACQDQTCQCHIPHKLCLKLSIQNLQQTILAGSHPLDSLKQKIETIFNDAIDKLSQERDKLILKIQNEIQYFGLNEKQRKFIGALYQKTSAQEMNCQFVWQILTGLNKEVHKDLKMDQINQNIVTFQKNFQKEICNFSGKITQLLDPLKQNQKQLFSGSKIIKIIEDEKKLIAFFDGKIVGQAKLLYRASQDEFLASKFYEKCNKVPNTLTVIETQFGKVIGGFTTHSWQKPQSGCYLPGEVNSKEHFIFSLTNNDKFTITKNQQNCVYLDSGNEYGPFFGGGYDMRVCDKANENQNSSVNMNSTFTNANYTYNSTSSKEKFAGGAKFKIKEWEVWQIEFKH